MKKKKWLLLFALMLFGVLGNSGKSYAAVEKPGSMDLWDNSYLERILVEPGEFRLDEYIEPPDCDSEIMDDITYRSDGTPLDYYVIKERAFNTRSTITDTYVHDIYRLDASDSVDESDNDRVVYLIDLLGDCFYMDLYRVSMSGPTLRTKLVGAQTYNYTTTSLCYQYKDTCPEGGDSGAGVSDVETFSYTSHSGYIPYNIDSLSELNEIEDTNYILRLTTNVPIFFASDTEGLTAYAESGDTSGAMNASQLNPEPETSYTNKNLYLKNIQPYNAYLKLTPVENAYQEWTYFPVYDGYDLDEVVMEIFYEYKYDAPHGGGEFNSSDMKFLSDCRNHLVVYPYEVVKAMSEAYSDKYLSGHLQNISGGTFKSSGDNVSLENYQTEEFFTSMLRVSFRLTGQGSGRNDTGRLYIYDLDLLSGKVNAYTTYVDDEGNYTTNDKYKTYDENGNVTVKTDATSGGSSSSSDNSFTVQDGAIQINVNPTFNVEGGAGGNGGDGGDGGNGGNGGWSFDFGSSGDNDGDGEDDGDGIHGLSIKEFLALITGGIGLLGSNGLISMLAETFSFVPEEFWRVVIFGMVAMIVVAIMRKF